MLQLEFTLSERLTQLVIALPIVTVAFFVIGCASTPLETIPTTNILMANSAGEAVSPCTGHLYKKSASSPDACALSLGADGTFDFGAHLRAMFEDADEFCRSTAYETTSERPKEQGGNARPSCRILIFIHGGLNSSEDSVGRAAHLARAIRKSGSYPIFVNWESGFVTSYRDHVFRINKGINEPLLRYFSPVVVPGEALIDETSSIAEALPAWVAEFRHAAPFMERGSTAWKVALQSYTYLQDCKLHPNPTCTASDQSGDHHQAVDINENMRQCADDKHPCKDLVDNRTPSERFFSRAAYVPTFPTKLLLPPVGIQAFGRGAWDIMYRRTATLFTTEAEFAVNLNGKWDSAVKSPTAAECEYSALRAKDQTAAPRSMLCEFIYRFEREFIPKWCGNNATALHGCGNLEIDLVGHSMGSIVINQWLRHAPNLQLSNIVYMAGATSVTDYRDTVYSYLNRQHNQFGCVPKRLIAAGNGGVPCTNVYHLVLHPTAEFSEKGWADLTPRGSLLVWIDNYFSRPLTPLDRTVGRFFNLMPELARTPDNLRDQIHAKVFRVGNKNYGCTNPQIHHDFSVFPFWEESFWNPQKSERGEPWRIDPENGMPDTKCAQRVSAMH
jgi:hypothetical protein